MVLLEDKTFRWDGNERISSIEVLEAHLKLHGTTQSDVIVRSTDVEKELLKTMCVMSSTDSYVLNIELRKLSLWFYVIIGIFAALAYSTGDGAEKIMETYPGIGEDIIEPHENVALFFFLGLMIVAGVALIGLYVTKTKERMLKKFNLYLFIAAVLISILAVKTGITGGAIRHSEIKNEYFKK